MCKVSAGKGRETSTIWWYKTDLNPDLLKRFKAGQWSRRH
jgi:hypothetical protein